MRPLILCLLLAGCNGTVSDLRERQAFADLSSAQPLNTIRDCLAGQWERRGGTTTVTPKGNGYSLALAYHGWGTIPAAVVDVADAGPNRSIRVFARGEGDTLRRELAACV